jgi:hypothetical protein
MTLDLRSARNEATAGLSGQQSATNWLRVTHRRANAPDV